jgi:hypothetical protein
MHRDIESANITESVHAARMSQLRKSSLTRGHFTMVSALPLGVALDRITCGGFS